MASPVTLPSGDVDQRIRLDGSLAPGWAVRWRSGEHPFSRHVTCHSSWSAVHRLADGTAVRLRLLRASDRKRLLAGFERLSSESRYGRFFTAMPTLPEAMLQYLLDTDGWDRLAIAADAADGDRDLAEGFGIARFIRLAEHPDTAEAAVTVVDHMQRRRLGTLLLAALADAARERGITKFRAEILRTNEPVRALLREHGGDLVSAPDDSVLVYDVHLLGDRKSVV
jgi:GNAT superfamily N-acetyltransferase